MDGNLTEIWVMKDYGVLESWKKILIFGLDTYMIEPLCLFGDREVLIR